MGRIRVAAPPLAAALIMLAGCARSANSPYDFDGDGFDDLLIGDPSWAAGRGAVWLIRGSADGPRMPELVLEGEPMEGLGAHLFHVGDRNGDGLSEVGVLPADRLGWEAVRRARSLGAGGSVEAIPLVVPSSDWHSDRSVSAVFGLDLDNDPRADALVGYHCGTRCSGSYLLSQSEPSETGGVSSSGFLYVPDADGDGRPDVVWRSSRSSVALGLVEQGVRAEVAVGGLVSTLQDASDLDGDGVSEIWVGVANEESGTVLPAVLTFAPVARLVEAQGVAPRADLDCDGFGDLAVAGEIIHGDPGLSFSRRSPLRRPLAELRPRLIDLDADGCRDEFGFVAGALALFPGRPDGTVGPAWTAALPASHGRVASVYFVGIDGTLVVRGQQDVSGRSAVLVLDGEVTTAGPELTPTVDVADLDADGTPDYLDHGAWGSFDSTIEPRSLGDFAKLAGDVDGDGHVDALVYDGDRRVILRGGPTFPDEVLAELPTVVGEREIVAAGDLDGDGRGDLVRTILPAATTEVWLGAAVVAGETTASGSYPQSLLALGDLDFDGLADLVRLEVGTATLYAGRRDALPTPDGEVFVLGPDHRLDEGAIATWDAATAGVQLYRLGAGGVVPHGEPVAVPALAGARTGPVEIEIVTTGTETDGSTTTLVYLPFGHADGGLLVPVRADGPGEPRLVRLPSGTADRLALVTWPH